MSASASNIKVRPNYFYALISVTLVLFLAGGFGSMIIQSQQLVRLFKEKVMIVVEIKNGSEENEVKELQSKISNLDYVKSKSVSFTSKEAAAKLMQEDFGTEVDLSQYNLGNPLYDIITFHVNADYMNPSGLERIANNLEQYEIVSDVNYEEGLAGSISGHWNKMGWVGLAISLILVLVAVFLIIYAIRQALYSDRFIIKNMHLVGATPSFISRPYIRMGMLGGVCSAIVAGVGLLFIRWWLMGQVPGLEHLFTLSVWGIIFALMLAFGIIITAGSTWLTVRNYLKSDINDLY